MAVLVSLFVKSYAVFFLGADDQLTSVEIAMIRETMKPRLDAIKNGTAVLRDGNSYFNQHINRLSE